MKITNFFLILFTFLSCSLFAGQSKLGPILGLLSIPCCGQAQYSVEVENINPTFSIQNINGTYVVTRQSQVIHEETITPSNTALSPGEKQTFVMEIPMELLLLDGLIEIFFEFGSDFDLNPDPTASLDAFVTGCGIVNTAAAGLFNAALFAQAEEREAYLYLFKELLKPGTIVQGSGGDVYTKQLTAFTWMVMVYNPFLRFEQPVQVALLDANTEELEIIDANYPPLISGVIYQPELNSLDRISGELPTVFPPPINFTFEEASSIPADSVCAILVSGTDFGETMKEGFLRDIDLMKKTLTQHKNGPRLPESSLLIRSAIDGYNRDSLLKDLHDLKDKYKHVYFYYSGHGSQFGQMNLGHLESDYLDYTTFTQALFDSGAKNYSIMIDACFAGAAITAICNHPEIENIDVEVITSSNNAKTSGTVVWTIDNMNQWFGKFTSQFFWAMKDNTVDHNGDGKVSFLEGFSKVNNDNFGNISVDQCPVAKDIKNNTITTIGQNVFQSALQIYGTVPLEHATIYVNPLNLPAGTIIQPFDQSQTFTLPARSYFSWINWNANASFGKEVTYAYTDQVTQDVTFIDGIQFWPILPDYPEYKAFDPSAIYSDGKYFSVLPHPVSISQQIITPPEPTDSKIAIVVSGFHPDSLHQQAIDASSALFLTNLANELLGDQFTIENIKTYKAITRNNLLDVLSSYQNQYDKVFFYFAGNSTADGKLCLGYQPEDWIDYGELYDGLGAIDSKGYKLFFDGSYSGLAVEYSNQTNAFDGKRLDVFTSSDADKPSYAEYYKDPLTSITSGVNFFTSRLMEHYGDPLAEQDGEAGTSHMEGFKKLFAQNPASSKGVRIFTLSAPKAFANRYLTNGANEEFSNNFRSLDLTLTIKFRSSSALDIHAQQLIDVRSQSSTDSHVFSISPVRQWKINGAWDIDPAFAADLVFHYRTDLDTPDGSEGVLGLVSRTSPEEDWTAWYPADYNETEKLITAGNVSDAREWAIARVEEIVGLHDPIAGVSGKSVFPNPATEKISISFDLDHGTDLLLRILDLNGKIVYSQKSKPYLPGEQMDEIELLDMVPGMYYVELADQQGRMHMAFVVK